MTPDGDLIPGSSTLFLISCVCVFFCWFFFAIYCQTHRLYLSRLPEILCKLRWCIILPHCHPQTCCLFIYRQGKTEKNTFKILQPGCASKSGISCSAACSFFFSRIFMHVSPAPVLFLFVRRHLLIRSLIGSDPNRSIKEAVFTSRGSLLIRVATESG